MTEGREPSTTCTIRFEPLLRKLRHEEWTAGVEIAPPPPQNRPPKPERGFVVARGSKIGKYELEDKLGHGTFGTVYTARDLELERRVAVKVLNPSHQHNLDVVTRFLQEARATARIKHAGIVTILDCGRIETELGELAYIVMELLEGETLTRRIDLAERLTAPVAIDICHQIAGALEAAHRADVLHRDVKPDNMFLVRDPLLASGVRVKVLDFGLAKLGRGGHTMVNTILGTPRYMSPEQTRSSAEIDARSDIYALGCILFEMITGRRPFEGDLTTLIERHQRAIPARVRTIVPETAPELDDLIACMLAKDPAKRPQTMVEVQRALLEIETETTHVVSRSSIARSAPKPVPKPVPQPAAKPVPKLLTKPAKPEPKRAPRPEPERAPKPEPKRGPTREPVQPPVEVASVPVFETDHNPRTTVSFPPPPPPASFDAPDPSNVTMIVQPLPPIRRRRFRRRIALGVSVIAVSLALLELLDRDAPAPLAIVEPPVIEPAPAVEPAPAPIASTPRRTVTPAAPVASKEITISDSEVPEPAVVKLRKQPPRTAAPPRPVAQPRVTRKKPTPTPPKAALEPKWDPNALFPNRPQR